MKAFLLTLSAVFLASSAFAGALKTSDFNDMIQENQKSEALLRKDLQKEAGIQLNHDKPGTIAKEKLQMPSEAQEIAVSSSRPFWRERKESSRKALDKADMKRLSQELDEASSN